MKKFVFFLAFIISGTIAQAQIKAITENGEQVILYDNGKWEYEDKSFDPAEEIRVNPKEFEKGKSSTFLVKSNRNMMGVWLDPKKWAFNKASTNGAAEYEFHYKEGELYGMMVNEKVEIPLDNLRQVALQNARSVASDVKIEKEEYRTVNGRKVLLMQISGVIQGMNFTYYGYYSSGISGTTQLITYTYGNLFSGYKETSEELLNGLVEI